MSGNIDFYTRLFNDASRGKIDEELIKAIFIYTLHQERLGEITITAKNPDVLGKYFYGVYKRWSGYGTYRAACQASKKWEGPTPKGVSPQLQAIINPYLWFSYQQIADRFRGVASAEQMEELPVPPAEDFALATEETSLPPMEPQFAEAAPSEELEKTIMGVGPGVGWETPDEASQWADTLRTPYEVLPTEDKRHWGFIINPGNGTVEIFYTEQQVELRREQIEEEERAWREEKERQWHQRWESLRKQLAAKGPPPRRERMAVVIRPVSAIRQLSRLQ